MLKRREEKVAFFNRFAIGFLAGKHEIEQVAAIAEGRDAKNAKRADEVEGAKGNQRFGVFLEATIEGLNADRLAALQIARSLHQPDRQSGNHQGSRHGTNHRQDVKEQHCKPVSQHQHGKQDGVTAINGKTANNPLPAGICGKSVGTHG